ncbi:hypothetical protein D9M70_561550 [compost metagenome]
MLTGDNALISERHFLHDLGGGQAGKYDLGLVGDRARIRGSLCAQCYQALYGCFIEVEDSQ